ncbi:hypothetical protein [Nocardia rhizosphaerihabitans]|uniref:Secreted protein n=1 Tax=Nocardia rhizosphaerihabitans TaxID=1691570 RepID=A0ABQ2KJV3_9NOCA|nr:hypothetical protein [Nocardia rhizosphaerihabitans]GGN83518.1 hypothetical protein GCM10011610_35870 [Nocardia rhizosphaerihabitans]
MRIKSTIAAGLLAVATVAGVSTVAAGNAAAGPAGTYYGTYATLTACRADGESPYTGGYYWECTEAWDGWDLYIWY